MGGSTDAFALYLSLHRVNRPTDSSKPSTSLAFHKEAESKFEIGTGTLKTDTTKPRQQELMTYEEVNESLDQEKGRGEVRLETEVVQANPTARRGRRLGGENGGIGAAEGGEQQGEVSVGERREMAVRAAERRKEEARGVEVGA